MNKSAIPLQLVSVLAVLIWQLAAAPGAMSMWARMSDQDLIDSSELIVAAELVEIEPGNADSSTASIYLGKLKVQRIFKGPPELEIVHLQLPDPAQPVSSSDLSYRVGQQGIWFLRPAPGADAGVYLADHPQRLWSLDQTGHLEQLLE